MKRSHPLGLFCGVVVGCATAGGPAVHEMEVDAAAEVDAFPVVVPVDASPKPRPDGPPDPKPDPVPDAAPVCMACSLVPQAGCGPSMACDLTSDPLQLFLGCTECRSVSVPGAAASTCITGDDCAAGWVCLGGLFEGSCVQYCATDADCATSQSSWTERICAIGIVAAGAVPVPGASVCSEDCSVFEAGLGCAAGWACHLAREQEGARRFFAACSAAGPGAQDATCANDQDCQPGYSCYRVDAAGTTKCLKNCNATSGLGCETPAQCRGLRDEAQNAIVLGGIHYGACL